MKTCGLLSELFTHVIVFFAERSEHDIALTERKLNGTFGSVRVG